MSLYDTDRPRSKKPLLLTLLVILVVGLVAAGILLRARFETTPPQIQLTPDTDALGTAPLEIRVSDAGAGLKSLAVTLAAGGTQSTLATERYPQAVAEKKVAVTLPKGTKRELPLSYELMNVNYKKSTIALTDRFLQGKVVPLLADGAARQGSPKEVFIAVNKRLRKENEDRITQVTQKATPAILWQGA